MQGKVNDSRIFKKQKSMLDTYIYELYKSKQATFKDSYPTKTQAKGKSDAHNYSLLEFQMQTLNLLDQAFFKFENKILANQKGLGKRIVLVNFLQKLRFKHLICGQFLVITVKSKLNLWKNLLNSWTSLESLIYDDVDNKDGMDALR